MNLLLQDLSQEGPDFEAEDLFGRLKHIEINNNNSSNSNNSSNNNIPAATAALVEPPQLTKSKSMRTKLPQWQILQLANLI